MFVPFQQQQRNAQSVNRGKRCRAQTGSVAADWRLRRRASVALTLLHTRHMPTFGRRSAFLAPVLPGLTSMARLVLHQRVVMFRSPLARMVLIVPAISSLSLHKNRRLPGSTCLDASFC